MEHRFALFTVAILLSHTLWSVLAWAEQPKAGVVTAVHGRATVARAILPAPALLKFKDDVFRQDLITTRQESIVRILLGGKALVTVRELSVLTVTEEPGRATAELQAGSSPWGL
jgi:hypothetical protein